MTLFCRLSGIFFLVIIFLRESNGLVQSASIFLDQKYADCIPKQSSYLSKNKVGLTSLSILFRSELSPRTENFKKTNPLKVSLIKAGLMTYVASMCVALPITLLPPAILHKAKILSKNKKELVSLQIGQFCSRWLMRIIPFASIKILTHDETKTEPGPSIWVCNHTSMLDIFVLLAVDKKLRNEKRRPIKIIYWKDLEKNPITGLLFKMCGFFAVEMEDNGNGNANQYKKSSFKALLKGIKQAFDEGFDVGILPEGQLNPTPEKGLLSVYPGAFSLARMSKRPIRMMGLYGLSNLWHPLDGMIATDREVKVTAYPIDCKFGSGEEFTETFKSVVGYFGANGEDHPQWKEWLSGTIWKSMIDKLPNEGDSNAE